MDIFCCKTKTQFTTSNFSRGCLPLYLNILEMLFHMCFLTYSVSLNNLITHLHNRGTGWYLTFTWLKNIFCGTHIWHFKHDVYISGQLPLKKTGQRYRLICFAQRNTFEIPKAHKAWEVHFCSWTYFSMPCSLMHSSVTGYFRIFLLVYKFIFLFS